MEYLLCWRTRPRLKARRIKNKMNVLTTGNSAKLYCLEWIEEQVLKKKEGFKILDLGCGTAQNVVSLLRLYPWIYYVGIEPLKQSYLQAKKNLNGLNASVYNANAYGCHKIVKERFDAIVSFSVLEHVYKRKDYLYSAKECLDDDGYFLINYDAGHFHSRSLKEKLKNIIGPILAPLGIERYYQSFVKKESFLKIVDEAGFRIIETKFFNTPLKGVYKVIPKNRRNEYMLKWLEFELLLNEIGIEYKDSLSIHFGTLNFILVHK